MRGAYKSLDDINWTEWLPGFVQDAVTGLAEMVPDWLSMTGGEPVVWNRGMSIMESKTVIQRRLRPYNSYSTLDGKRVYVTVENRMGNVDEQIYIDFDAAGKWYMSQHPFWIDKPTIPPAPVQFDVDGNPLQLLLPMPIPE